MDFLSGLNPQQQEAVRHLEGPLLILAGAGSGKTRVITHRIAHLMTAQRVPGWAILAVTFTNKAAGEMRDRIAALLARANAEGQGLPEVSTFHSFCVRLLRRDGDRLAEVRPGFTRKFNIYDDADQTAVVKQVCRQNNIDEKQTPARSLLSRISQAKNSGNGPEEFQKSNDPGARQFGFVYERYEDALKQANAVDFDDLLLLSVKLLAHDEAVRDKYNQRFSYLMIDEYQDTNRPQYELIRLLTKRHSNLAVVGDEDQSIYGWRGADIKNILDFERDYPNAKVIRLEQNYRSTQNILSAASAVVALNTQRIGKTLWTEAADGAPITLYEGIDGEQEALWVADSIEKLMDRDPKAKIAVLYRTNFQSRQLEEALRRYGRKYVVVGGISFYQRAEVKDVLSYLKLLVSPHDSIALGRVINTPARGIGKTTVDQIEAFARDNKLSMWNAMAAMLRQNLFSTRAHLALESFTKLVLGLQDTLAEKGIDEAIRELLERSGYRRMLVEDKSQDAESRLGNLEELINAAADASQRGEGVAEFLDHAALVAQTDEIDNAAPISLMTMHNAKGLEFPIVFVVGMEEGLFPSSRAKESDAGLEEERRLCYVALTRAEKHLFLTLARSRRRYGAGMPEPTMRSRFIAEIPPNLLRKAQPGRFFDTELPQVDLGAEQHLVRDTVKRTTYTGKTYNSVENISQFFRDRGVQPPMGAPAPAASESRPAPPPPPQFKPDAPAPARPSIRPVKPKALRSGSRVSHPKYGSGTLLRIEGEGEEAKLTISFRSGLKKMVAKYAGITIDE